VLFAGEVLFVDTQNIFEFMCCPVSQFWWKVTRIDAAVVMRQVEGECAGPGTCVQVDLRRKQIEVVTDAQRRIVDVQLARSVDVAHDVPDDDEEFVEIGSVLDFLLVLDECVASCFECLAWDASLVEEPFPPLISRECCLLIAFSMRTLAANHDRSRSRRGQWCTS
jgi:hypothetical protein